MPSDPQNPTLAMDGRMLGETRGGVATYARALARAQRAIDPGSLVLRDGPRDSPSPVGQGRWRRRLRALMPGVRTAEARAATPPHPADLHAPDVFRLAQVYFDIHRRPLALRAPGPPRIMHWTYPVPLRLEGWINVYTVHDVIPLLDPTLSPIDPRRHRRLLRAILRPGAEVATVSEAARHDILRLLGCDPARVTNCAQAVEASPGGTPPDGLAPGGYVLACGSVEPRKNIGAIVAAHRRSGIALPLVIAGPDGWRSGGFAFDAPDILRLRDVDERTMPALIANARLLLMPSLAEGFGLPVAEAMALGTPVVTSAGGALAETAGDAALLVDPRDVDGIANAIRMVCDDHGLRRTLIGRGLRNAERFTPARFATRMAAFYADVVERRPVRAYAPGERRDRRGA